MFLYAIRHKPSGLFLPNSPKQQTYTNPTANCIPRLFKKKSHAKCALTAWLAGKFRWRSSTSSWEFSTPDEVELIIDPVPDRKPDDMEIVILTLTEHGVYS